MDQNEEKPKHPITGEPYDEEVERAKLIPVDQIKDAEVQAKFKDFIRESLRDNPEKRKINAKKLLEITSRATWVFRSYFSYVPNRDTFQERASINFTETEGNYNLTELIKYGEDRGDSTHLVFDQVKILEDGERKVVWEGLQISLSNQGNYIEINYDDNGQIIKFNLIPQGVYHRSTNIDIPDLKNKKRIIVTEESFDYEWEYNEVNSTIVYKRIKGSRLLDNMFVPTKIDKEQVISDLCPRELIKNPYEASSDLDNKWLDKDILKDAFGIDWQRS